MKSLLKPIVLAAIVASAGCHITSTSSVNKAVKTEDSVFEATGYEGNNPGKAVVKGAITFKGTPPPPKLFELAKFSKPTFCGKADNDGKGNRIVRGVTVNNGRLQDVVVYIQNISNGKQFKFNGTDVKIDRCRYIVLGGPSTFVGVVAIGAEIRVQNMDADPSDPKSVDGVLHNPHAYNKVSENNFRTIFNRPLPAKGQILKYKFTRLESPIILLEGDQMNFMQAWFYRIENPYYAIVGPDGAYSIDQVPAGKYKIIAWHPILGTQEKEIEVGNTGKVTADFQFPQ
jgi:hypothetical protein